MTDTRSYIGLDLGTSGLRGLLVSADGTPLASAEAQYDVAHPHPGWSEQDPADWIAALDRVVTALREEQPEALARLAGIAVSGHMHGAVVLDAAGEVLRPCILWNDTRSHAQAARLDGMAEVRELSGNIVFPGFTAPKLVWLAEHEPDLFAQISRVLLPAAYLNFWLTGDAVGDMSDASGTSWLDVGQRCWSASLLDASGMRADQMPRLVEGCAAAGTLRPDLASTWGVSKDVVVAGGGGDNAVAACGAGALSEGQGFVSLGTSGVILVARDAFSPEPATAVHTFCHAVPDRWYQMGVILAATDSLNWLARQTGSDAAALTAALGQSVGPPGTVQFLPYLSGERTPHNDSAIRGAFLNLDIATGPEDLTKAVLEGVAFALRDSLDALRGAGAQISRLMAIGGGAQSPYWVELCATVLDLPLDRPDRGEFGAALGAARLAICAATGAAPETVMTPPAISDTVAPRDDLKNAYAEALTSWRATYPKLKELS